MSYMALYRKFRPDKFEDVKGQEHIVTTLKNQIQAGRIGHAYLFVGTRGTGKTTIAKLFAKAVNCENPENGNPCNACPSCKAIQAQASMNVIEIDAASNNGVDSIREIRDEVAYSPAEGRYKVYIIDEVHMLSMSAFNALLKTLEEPPSYAIFILATTEAHKIPLTILSRCQRYDFRKMAIDTIAGRLTELMEIERISVEERAVRCIAKAADGSMRDALSLLEECISFYLGGALTYEGVLEVLGAVDTEVFGKLLNAIAMQDILACIHEIDRMASQGKELSQFVADFTWYLRNLLLVKTSRNPQDAIDMSAENLEDLKARAKPLGTQQILSYIRIFSELSAQIRYASQKRVALEMAVIKLCIPAMNREEEGLAARIEALEKRMEQQPVPLPQEMQVPGQEQTARETAGQGKPAAKKILPKAIPEDVQEIVKKWDVIIQHAPGNLKGYLKNARLSLGVGNKLQIVTENDVNTLNSGNSTSKEDLERLIEGTVGKKVEIEIVSCAPGKPFEEQYVDLISILKDSIDADIVIEDDDPDD